jgi:phosphodiesterase/alkaline phosphatase D-like protein
MAALPALAGAVTLAPLLGPVTATPGMTNATLNATIYPYGADTQYHFEYGTTTSYGTSVPVPAGDAGSAAYPTTVSEMQTIGGLQPNTTYHYRLVASNSLGSATGPEAADKTFTTTGTPPVVTAEPASPIAGGFTLSGTVNPEGAATTYRFEYGTTTAYGTNIPVPDASAGSGSTAAVVSQNVTGLLPNTTYHFRLSARHGSGTPVTTTDQTFLTPPSGPAPPTAVVSAPVESAGGAQLKGVINPNGVDTHYHFEFGLTTTYGQNLPDPDADVGSGSSAVSVSQEVTGLQPNTTYHYRVVAESAEGPGQSTDQTFKTLPLAPVVTALPFTESTSGWSLNGTVNAEGAATTYHFQFGITTAYGSNVPATDASAGSSTSAISVTQLVESLPPGVPYHYRLVAHNAGGTSTSNDEEFVTPSTPETPETPEAPPAAPVLPGPVIAPPPTPAPSSQITARAAAVKGAVATMKVAVPGAGTVSASGKGLKAVKVSAKGPGW